MMVVMSTVVEVAELFCPGRVDLISRIFRRLGYATVGDSGVSVTGGAGASRPSASSIMDLPTSSSGCTAVVRDLALT